MHYDNFLADMNGLLLNLYTLALKVQVVFS